MNKDFKGICRLCLKEKILIKRSHLFPNFMYKGIGDDIKRINVISSSKPFQKKKVQSGAYEENILCADCDNNLLSKLERYANNFLYSQPYRTNNESFEQVPSFHGISIIRCKNIDYQKFKLFLQSLIWRASVSTHQLFKNFKLTEQQEEQLRSSLIESIPLEEDNFACQILTPQNIQDVKTDFVLICSTMSNEAYFFINQFIYIFYTDTEFDLSVKDIRLNKKNEMGIIKLSNKDWTSIRTSIINGMAALAKSNY